MLGLSSESHTHSLESPVLLHGFGMWRKPEYLEETYMDTGRACRLCTEGRPALNQTGEPHVVRWQYYSLHHCATCSHLCKMNIILVYHVNLPAPLSLGEGTSFFSCCKVLFTIRDPVQVLKLYHLTAISSKHTYINSWWCLCERISCRAGKPHCKPITLLIYSNYVITQLWGRENYR